MFATMKEEFGQAPPPLPEQENEEIPPVRERSLSKEAVHRRDHFNSRNQYLVEHQSVRMNHNNSSQQFIQQPMMNSSQPVHMNSVLDQNYITFADSRQQSPPKHQTTELFYEPMRA